MNGPRSAKHRQVYHTPRFNSGWLSSFLAALALGAFIFGILPFTTVVSTQRHKELALRQTDLAAPPPVAEETPPPPPPEEEEKPPEETPPTPADAPQQLNLSADLDNVGGAGGALHDNIGNLAADVGAEVGDTFDASELDNRPEPVAQPAPAYPRELSKAKIDGRVVIAFVVTEDGRVEDARIENSTRPEFEAPALEAIRKWRFKPGQKEGQPVRTYVKQPLKFTPPAR
ncbi:MAG: energy transducer TonB [Limisphaerales bacterium]